MPVLPTVKALRSVPAPLTPDQGSLARRRRGSAPAALTVAGGWEVEGSPPLVRRAGPRAAERLVEFFTAQIRNAHTRAGSTSTRFRPIAVATYLDALQDTCVDITDLVGHPMSPTKEGDGG